MDENASLDCVELDAGPTQLIVVYLPEDTGDEVDPVGIYTAVAADAATRAAQGWVIVSMTAMQARHAQEAWGREGSGYTTKVSVAAVYAKA